MLTRIAACAVLVVSALADEDIQTGVIQRRLLQASGPSDNQGDGNAPPPRQPPRGGPPGAGGNQGAPPAGSYFNGYSPDNYYYYGPEYYDYYGGGGNNGGGDRNNYGPPPPPQEGGQQPMDVGNEQGVDGDYGTVDSATRWGRYGYGRRYGGYGRRWGGYGRRWGGYYRRPYYRRRYYGGYWANAAPLDQPVPVDEEDVPPPVQQEAYESKRGGRWGGYYGRGYYGRGYYGGYGGYGGYYGRGYYGGYGGYGRGGYGHWRR